MKILMTGITGFVGRQLAPELFKRGHELIALARNPNRVRAQHAIPIKSYFWDGIKSSPPVEALKDIHIVVNLAGEPVAGGRWSEERRRAIYESRALTTRNLAKGISAHASNCSLFVSASAVGYYGSRGEEVLSEDSPPGNGFLSEVCLAWEREAEEHLPVSLRRTYLRTGVVLGRNGGALTKLLPLFAAGLGGPVDTGNQWMSWIHLDDLIAMIVWAIEDNRVKGPLNATAPAPTRNSIFTGVLAKCVRRPALARVPKAALALVMGKGSSLVTDSQRVLPEKALMHGFTFNFPDVESALHEITSPAGFPDAQQKLFHHFVPQELEKVFLCFADEKNLEKIIPPWFNFKVLPKLHRVLRKGTLIDYTFKIHGLPAKWRTEICEWHPPRSFLDIQLRGPFNLWHHEHFFEPCNGGTLLTDRITYRLPLGNLGTFFAESLVSKEINRFFDFRRKAIDRIFTA